MKTKQKVKKPEFHDLLMDEDNTILVKEALEKAKKRWLKLNQ